MTHETCYGKLTGTSSCFNWGQSTIERTTSLVTRSVHVDGVLKARKLVMRPNCQSVKTTAGVEVYSV